MKVSPLHALVLLIAIASTLSVAAQSGTLAYSLFDNNPDGWTMSGVSDGSGKEAPNGSEQVKAIGDSLHGRDGRADHVWYFVAPAKFLGGGMAAYDGRLTWQAAQDKTDSQFDAPDVLLFGNGITLALDAGPPPQTAFGTYSAEINECAGWRRVENGVPGKAASRDELQSVLRNLQGLWIRGEYRLGEDQSKIRDVFLEGGGAATSCNRTIKQNAPAMIAPGFAGKVYRIAEGTEKIPPLAGLQPVLNIVLPSLNVPSRDYMQGFPEVPGLTEWFAIDFTGRIHIPTAGRYTFRLASDDGSRLFVDGREIIDNDGVHATAAKETTLQLSAGDRQIRVLYFQGPGSVLALELSVRGAANEAGRDQGVAQNASGASDPDLPPVVRFAIGNISLSYLNSDANQRDARDNIARLSSDAARFRKALEQAMRNSQAALDAIEAEQSRAQGIRRQQKVLATNLPEAGKELRNDRLHRLDRRRVVLARGRDHAWERVQEGQAMLAEIRAGRGQPGWPNAPSIVSANGAWARIYEARRQELDNLKQDIRTVEKSLGILRARNRIRAQITRLEDAYWKSRKEAARLKREYLEISLKQQQATRALLAVRDRLLQARQGLLSLPEIEKTRITSISNDFFRAERRGNPTATLKGLNRDIALLNKRLLVLSQLRQEARAGLVEAAGDTVARTRLLGEAAYESMAAQFGVEMADFMYDVGSGWRSGGVIGSLIKVAQKSTELAVFGPPTYYDATANLEYPGKVASRLDSATTFAAKNATGKLFDLLALLRKASKDTATLTALRGQSLTAAYMAEQQVILASAKKNLARIMTDRGRSLARMQGSAILAAALRHIGTTAAKQALAQLIEGPAMQSVLAAEARQRIAYYHLRRMSNMYFTTQAIRDRLAKARDMLRAGYDDRLNMYVIANRPAILKRSNDEYVLTLTDGRKSHAGARMIVRVGGVRARRVPPEGLVFRVPKVQLDDIAIFDGKADIKIQILR